MSAAELGSGQEDGWVGEELASAWAKPLVRFVGLASLVVGVTAAGLLVGRELRIRYKFKRRTPLDFFSKAGEALAGTEYGMGV